jgi:hypothetical protein
MRGWIFVAILALLVAGGIATAIVVGDGWDRHHAEVTRVVGANGEETIVIRDGRPFFFPFGIFLVPLVFLLFFGLMRAFFWRGRWGGGPWNSGGGPGNGAPRWFDDWHRRAHATGGQPPAPPVEGTSEERSG